MASRVTLSRRSLMWQMTNDAKRALLHVPRIDARPEPIVRDEIETFSRRRSVIYLAMSDSEYPLRDEARDEIERIDARLDWLWEELRTARMVAA